jgi:anti-sigma regulatory factor (Ser/Thr protein kinase)
MTDQLELTLLNEQTEIARAQDEFEKFAARHSFAKRVLHDVQLALEEHLANIVNHAYPDDLEHRIQVRFVLTPPELRIEIEDDGRAFNPLEHPSPDLSVPLDQRPVGGLGIHMMRKSLDELKYRREHERNVLVMLKRL